jgi:hypothetical protein
MVKRKIKKPTKHLPNSEQIVWKNRLFWLGKWAGLPLLIYFIFFGIFTMPWIAHFNDWFYTDNGDGLQNVWNMWWIHKAVVSLHDLPWYTSYLHFPWGVTLLGQTLNPFNGFAGIVLQGIFGLSLKQAFNTLIVFSFLMGGLSTFWLCYYFSKSYFASIVGGFIFTFSSYHFAHAIGHMQLISLEWIPLFILLWWKLLKKPSYMLAIGASLSLFLVLFCDYYYFLYSLITAGFIFVYLLWKKELPPLKIRSSYLPLVCFGVLSLIIIAPLPVALLRLNSHEILEGSHPARLLSSDIFTPFIDGNFWHFHSLTDGYWKHVNSYVLPGDSSVYFTYALLFVVFISWIKRKQLSRYLGFWWFIALFFGIMSLGPRLHMQHHYLEIIPAPYVILEKLIPGLELSGVPVRMLVMTILAMAVVASVVLARLNLSQWRGRILLALFVLIYSLEVLPVGLPMAGNSFPAYTYALRKLPNGAVLDNAAKSEPMQLLNQTNHDKPMILGYISRTPRSLSKKEAPMVDAYTLGKYASLCKNYKLRYVTTSAKKPLNTTFPIVYKDENALIYDLKDSPNC